MRIALCPINAIVGAVEANTGRMEAEYHAACSEGAQLVVFPECAIPGYPAKDLLTRPAFVQANLAALGRLAALTEGGGPPMVVGYAEPHEGDGHRLYNAAAWCANGRVQASYRKMLLPTYDVFDEARYFDSGREACAVEHAGHRVALTVCEDIWNDEDYWDRRLYPIDPVEKAVQAGATVVLNISASPFTLGKPRAREAMLASTARRHHVPVVYLNLNGGNDDLIFDGGALTMGPDGALAARTGPFTCRRSMIEVNTEGRPSGAIDAALPDLEQLRRALCLGIRDYVVKCGFRDVLIGLSGGIDSALVATLAAEALGPAQVHGVAMPSRYSSDHSVADARALAQNLGIRFSIIPIESMFAEGLRSLEPHFGGLPPGIAEENMQSRLRGFTLMTLSNKHGALVLTTGNKSEMAVGYCTLYGDMCGGLAVIADVPKTMVYDLSRHLNATAPGTPPIPQSTIDKPPSAELRPDQKDTDSLPPYEVLDPLIRQYVEEGLGPEEMIARGADAATVRRVVRLVEINEYKRRQSAPTLKVTSRAFGYGWRMPIARGR